MTKGGKIPLMTNKKRKIHRTTTKEEQKEKKTSSHMYERQEKNPYNYISKRES
jgi:hypothetical protein